MRTSYPSPELRSVATLLVIVLVTIVASPLTARPVTKRVDHPHARHASPTRAHSPLPIASPGRIAFVQNMGQVADQFERPLPNVLYTVRDNSMRIDILKHSLRFQFAENAGDGVAKAQQESSPRRYHRMDVIFEGANPDVRLEACDTTPEYYNFYLSHCPGGITGVRSFRRLLYHDLYDGIDMVLYSTAGSTISGIGSAEQMKYDFIVRPGADPSQIRMRVIGADSISATDTLLILHTPLGFVREQSPFSYSLHTGDTSSVSCRYDVHGDLITLNVGTYSTTDTLVIDPPRLWGTYFGGSSNDYIYYVTADKDDNVIAAGGSYSSSGISSPGAYQTSLGGTIDAIVLKFGPDGTRKWSTYYGHSSGSATAYGVTTDRHSNIVIVGYASATSGIATTGAHQSAIANSIDGMIVKFDSNGVRLWGSYYGGSSGITNLYGVCSDSADNLIATGQTGSSTGIVTSGAFHTTKGGVQCGFVVKFDGSGVRKWGTYISDHSNVAQSSPPAVDQRGAIYVCGVTSDSTGIATSGTFQPTVAYTAGGAGYILCFDSTGARNWGTYVQENSSNASSQCTGVATDRAGHVDVVGMAGPYGGIATSGSYQSSPQSTLCGFILQLDSAGSRKWGSYFSGTNGGTQVFNVNTDRSGDILFIGRTTATAGLSSAGEYQTAFGGAPWDCYFTKFRSNGSFRWASYYGGSGDEQRSAGSMDREGHPLLAGYTTSTSVFASPGAFQTSLAGAYDGYIARFCDTVTAPLFTSKPRTDICYGDADTLLAGVGFSSYQWRKDGAALPGATAQRYIIPSNLAVGIHRYTVDVTDPYACQTSTDTIALTVHAVPTLTFGSAPSLCRGDSVRLIPAVSASGTVFYKWTPNIGLSADSIAQPYARPVTSTQYYLQITDGLGCSVRDSILVTVNPTPQLNPSSAVTICAGSGQSIGAAATSGTPPYLYAWSPATGLSSTSVAQPIATPAVSTDYRQSVTDANGCTATAVIHVTVNPKPSVDAGSDLAICAGSSALIGNAATLGTPPYLYSWSPSQSLSDASVSQPIATPATTTKYFVTVTDAKGCTATDSIVLTVNPVPLIDVGSDRTICFGDSVRVGSLATSGTPPYTYSWTPSIGLSRTDVAQPIASPASTTRFYLRVTDAKGCEVLDSILISVHPTPTVRANKAVEICDNGTAVLTATATGGTAPYTFTWTPSIGLADPSQPSTTANPHHTTTYAVVVTDANGCQSRDSVRVTVHPLPVPVILPTGPVVFCAGDSVTLYPGGTFAAYFWSTGEQTDHIVVRHSTTLTLTVIDSLGCSATSAPMQIVENPLPLLDLKGPNSVCPNATCSYSITNVAGQTYIWSLGGGGMILSGQGTPSVQVRWASVGSWNLTVRVQSGTGCWRDSTITIAVTPELHPAVTPSGSVTICQGDTVIIRASAGYSEYRWSNGAITDSIIVTTSGTYSVVVKDDQGCSGASDAIVVTVASQTQPKPIIAGKATLCAGDSLVLRTTEAYSYYRWSTGDTTPTIVVRQAGTYSVAVKNAAGCDGSSPGLNVTVAPKPIVQITPPTPQTICSGESVTLTATSGLINYRWSTGDQGPSITVSQPGSYYVSAENAEGCSSTSAAVQVVVNPTPAPVISGPRSVCTGSITQYTIDPLPGSTIDWQLTPAGAGTVVGQGTPNVTIQWSGVGTGVITVLQRLGGCIGTATISVSIEASLTPSIVPSGAIHLCEGDSVTLHADRGYSRYEWKRDGVLLQQTQDSLRVGSSGAYSVYVTLNGSCTGESQPVVVNVTPTPPKPTITRTGATLSASAATGYQWIDGSALIPGANAQQFSPNRSGTYSVTIIDANGCTSKSDPIFYSVGGRATVVLPPILRAQPGDVLAVPLTLTDAEGITESGATSFTATLRYNASLLVPQPLNGTEVNGVRTMVVRRPLPRVLPSLPATLTTLTFTATLGTDTCTDLLLDTVYFENADVNVTYHGGEFCLSGVCIADGHVRLIDPTARISLALPYPNPVRNTVELRYELAEDGLMRLTIEDLLGKTRMVVRDEDLKRGSHSDHIDLHHLPSGSYRVVLRTPSDTRTQRLEVLR